MDGACQLPLARPALPGDEHGGARRRHLPRDPIHLLHRWARTDEPLQPFAIALPNLPAQILRFHAEFAALERALHRERERVEVDRLRKVVLGSCTHRLDRRSDVTESRAYDDGHGLILLSQFLEERDPVHPRHLQIGDDDVGRRLGEAGESLFAILRRIDGIPLLPQ